MWRFFWHSSHLADCASSKREHDSAPPSRFAQLSTDRRRISRRTSVDVQLGNRGSQLKHTKLRFLNLFRPIEMLTLAETEGFDVFITGDKQLIMTRTCWTEDRSHHAVTEQLLDHQEPHCENCSGNRQRNIWLTHSCGVRDVFAQATQAERCPEFSKIV